MDPRQYGIGQAQLMECLTIVIKRYDSGNLFAQCFDFGVAQPIP
jgi:hypothetical protein